MYTAEIVNYMFDDLSFNHVFSRELKDLQRFAEIK